MFASAALPSPQGSSGPNCPQFLSQREEALVLRKSIHTQRENLQDALTTIEKRGIPDIQIFCNLLSPMLKIDPEDRINVG